MDAARLSHLLQEWGEPTYRLSQVRQAQRTGAMDWDDVSALPKSLRTRLAEEIPLWTGEIAGRAQSTDGTVKWGLRSPDGTFWEAVLIAHARGRRTLCVSSQGGCALACRFCATGDMGPGRDLTASEIIDQALLAAHEADGQGTRLTNVVYMGMGEPLQNPDEVLDAAGWLTDPAGLGLSARRVAISTVGWVPGISRLAKERLGIRLAVSLHAADDETRSELMPINLRYPIANLLAACRRYRDQTGRRVFIEYLLLDGVNDSPHDARNLAALLRDGDFHVNLIQYNPTSGPYRASPPERRRAFAEALSSAGLRPSIRRSRGSDIAAACGQLAADA